MNYWKPAYKISTRCATALMQIESMRVELEHTAIPPLVEAELRRKARVRSTHFSTSIEGNRLTLEEAENVIEGRERQVRQRERDVNEVKNYWSARVRLEEWAVQGRRISEKLVQQLHGMAMRGKRGAASSYRKGQNAIRDSGSGTLVYLPPEAHDVAPLMAGLIEWINSAIAGEVPVPVVAGLAHYQFVTIHPYYDGNGRTARLLATFILQRYNYGLGGFLSVEEFHARDLAGYYAALAVHPHHNYYMGRETADLSGWIEYFVMALAAAYQMVQKELKQLVTRGVDQESDLLRRLDRRARIVLGLFGRQNEITTRDVAAALGLSERMARILIKDWLEEGWLVMVDTSRKARAYGLSATYRQFVR